MTLHNILTYKLYNHIKASLRLMEAKYYTLHGIGNVIVLFAIATYALECKFTAIITSTNSQPGVPYEVRFFASIAHTHIIALTEV